MTPPSAWLEGVSKRYVKLEERRALLTSLLPGVRAGRSEVWALRDVDIRIEQGESVGVIGPNGAGKTTLLRIMAGVTRPSLGRARVWGRVAPLLAVGVGFHREMTGRQNIFMNAAMLGVPHQEAEHRFDEIVEFSGVGYAIDTPVKHYSSGMYVRLGFAVAMHVDPEVLLVDEGLAVGDAGFQRQCLERLTEMHSQGVTLVLVSHSMQSISSLCDRAVLIEGGRKTFDGDVGDGVARYHQLLDPAPTSSPIDVSAQRHVGGVSLVEVAVDSPDGDIRSLPAHARVEVDALVAFHLAVASPCLSVGITNRDGAMLAAFHSPVGAIYRTFSAGETAHVRFAFEAHLAGGEYTLTVWVTSSQGVDIYLQSGGLPAFRVRETSNVLGVVDLNGAISIDGYVLEGFDSGRDSSPERNPAR